MSGPLVGVDARMIRHSGIGIVLRGLLRHWSANPPPFRLALCGDSAQLREEVPGRLSAEIVAWNPRLYSLAAAIGSPRIRCAAWYSPHYATSLTASRVLIAHVQDVLHITHPTRRGTAIYNRLYLAALRRRAAFVLTTSRHVKVQLQTLHGFRADRVLRTGLGPGNLADGENARALPRPDGFPARYLLAVGIVKRHKNWEFLFDRLRHDTSGLPLVCAGAGPHRDKLRALAARHGVADRVLVLDWIDDAAMPAVYRHAEALLYPSLAEGFGLPVLEAMAVGTPVIVADRSPMKEIAAGCALVFDPDWPESFDAALRDILGNAETRRRCSETGLTRAQEFTWAKTAAVVEDAIERGMKRKG